MNDQSPQERHRIVVAQQWADLKPLSVNEPMIWAGKIILEQYNEIDNLRKSRRKLARWLPFARPLIELLWREDMPEHLIHDCMSPEDWIDASEEAIGNEPKKQDH